jgi:hypothetical protein
MLPILVSAIIKGGANPRLLTNQILSHNISSHYKIKISRPYSKTDRKNQRKQQHQEPAGGGGCLPARRNRSRRRGGRRRCAAPWGMRLASPPCVTAASHRCLVASRTACPLWLHLASSLPRRGLPGRRHRIGATVVGEVPSCHAVTSRRQAATSRRSLAASHAATRTAVSSRCVGFRSRG